MLQKIFASKTIKQRRISYLIMPVIVLTDKETEF